MISEEHEIASIYSPSQPIEVTFCGEPAIGDGGPKREYCGMDSAHSICTQWCCIYIIQC